MGKCKDIPDASILGYLADRQGRFTLHYDLEEAFPPETPWKVRLSKMRRFDKRGLIDGCTCGCRGDFEITDKGLALIGRARTTPSNYKRAGQV